MCFSVGCGITEANVFGGEDQTSTAEKYFG
jgi:hypothetical protein